LAGSTPQSKRSARTARAGRSSLDGRRMAREFRHSSSGRPAEEMRATAQRRDRVPRGHRAFWDQLVCGTTSRPCFRVIRRMDRKRAADRLIVEQVRFFGRVRREKIAPPASNGAKEFICCQGDRAAKGRNVTLPASARRQHTPALAGSGCWSSFSIFLINSRGSCPKS
jgi:hypothetical protein